MFIHICVCSSIHTNWFPTTCTHVCVQVHVFACAYTHRFSFKALSTIMCNNHQAMLTPCLHVDTFSFCHIQQSHEMIELVMVYVRYPQSYHWDFHIFITWTWAITSSQKFLTVLGYFSTWRPFCFSTTDYELCLKHLYVLSSWKRLVYDMLTAV